MTNCQTVTAHAVDAKLREATERFIQLMDACPPELRARQFVKQERREGFLWVEIRTTFKVPIEGSDA